MTPPTNWRWHAGAFAIYAVAAIVFIDHGVSLTQVILGAGGDPQLFIWFLAWWPWAIAHHVSLLHTDLVWQPLGAPILWLTSIPLLSLLCAPITLIWGPVLSLNLLVLSAPVLSGFGAYFLCGYVTRSPPAAVIGGFLFGFSSYQMAADLATINLAFTAFVPLLALLLMQRMNGGISRWRCVALGSLMMICQFFICIEIFATIVLFGSIAWAAAYRTVPHRRAALRAIFVDAVLAGAIVTLFVSPFLLSMAHYAHYLSLPPKWRYIFAANLLNFVIPTQVTALGGHASIPINKSFFGGPQEADAYLGIPLISIIILYARESWRSFAGAFLLTIFAVFVIASLGPRLWIGGTLTTIFLPWFAFLYLPLISSALPGRFALYVSLAAALIAAFWVARQGGGTPRRLRMFAGILACIALLPARHVTMKIPVSIFFAPGHVQAALGSRSRILVLPFGGRGASTYWQAENHFGYLQTGGYLGYPPAAMQHFPVVEQLFDAFELPGFLTDLQKFCAATQTQYIVAGPGTPAAVSAALGKLGWSARRIDDVTVYTVPATGMVHG